MEDEKRQIVDELHRTARRNYKQRKTNMRGIHDTLQADLIEMKPYAKVNRNKKYILTVINIFSKKAYARALKNKTGKEVTIAMESILNSLGYSIKKIHVDNGKEFYNNHMKNMLEEREIQLYSTYTTKKAAIVERFNRTLKNKIWKAFSYNKNRKWFDILEDLIISYNNTKHRTIKMKPNDVNIHNEQYLLNTVYNYKWIIKEKPKFKIGDYVRMSKYKHLFEKGYTPNWTTEIFRIFKIMYTNPITYRLTDYYNDEIKGTYYTEELQLVKYPNLYLIEKIIRKKGNKVYIKWLGFNSTHNIWIDKNNII